MFYYCASRVSAVYVESFMMSRADWSNQKPRPSRNVTSAAVVLHQVHWQLVFCVSEVVECVQCTVYMLHFYCEGRNIWLRPYFEKVEALFKYWLLICGSANSSSGWRFSADVFCRLETAPLAPPPSQLGYKVTCIKYERHDSVDLLTKDWWTLSRTNFRGEKNVQ